MDASQREIHESIFGKRPDYEYTSLPELVKELSNTRNITTTLQDELNKLKSKFEEDNKQLIQDLKQGKSETEMIENIVRKKTLDEHNLTKEKSFCDDKVTIKIFNETQYDENEAFTWAKQKDMCLMLDKKAFEKIATTGQIPFVKFTEQPKVFISKNLE